VEQMTNEAIERLSKRMKQVYLITGGFAGIAVFELILLLIKVI
jgi:hypothetical protein